MSPIRPYLEPIFLQRRRPTWPRVLWHGLAVIGLGHVLGWIAGAVLP